MRATVVWLVLVLGLALSPARAETPAGGDITLRDATPGFEAAYVEAKDARQAVMTGDFDRALSLARPLAESGNPVAQNIIGAILTDETSPHFEPFTGMEWYMRAAAQGYRKAWNNMGRRWHDGAGPIHASLPLSLAAYRTAALMGYKPAMERTVAMLLYGPSEISDEAAGVALLDQGLAMFPDSIALREDEARTFYAGLGRAANRERAFALYRGIAEETGSRNAIHMTGYMLLYGQGTAQDAPAAADFLEQAWARGRTSAAADLPVAYGHPDFAGPQTDPVRGWAWCLVAEREGFMTAEAGSANLVAACDNIEALLSAEDAATAAELAGNL